MFKSLLTLGRFSFHKENKAEFFKNGNSQTIQLTQIQTQESPQQKSLLVGNRIPKNFFLTTGIGESDITIHAGSYHLALKDAGIEKCNIITYSSILPAIATEINKSSASELTHGAVIESIMACADSTCGERATSGLIIGWLHDKETNKKYGGLVCEYHGNQEEDEAAKTLWVSLNELHANGFSEKFNLSEIKIVTKSFIPEKRFGTAIVALCFTDYAYPILGVMS
jgi:arginine decarboxylase